MDNQLIKTENLVPMDVFKSGGTDSIIKAIESEVEKHEPDLTTAKGRKEIASLASKVSKSKTFLDGMGKKLKADYKAIIDPIDAERKRMRESLDELRDKARKPLTDWETEQERIVELERKQVEFDLDWDTAIAENDLFNRELKMKEFEAEQVRVKEEQEAKVKAEQAEKDRIAYAAKVKADAEAKAKSEAEGKIKAEKESAVKKMKEARIERIGNLGLFYDGESFVKDDINIHTTELLLDDTAFETLISKVTKELEIRKQAFLDKKANEEEKKRKDDAGNARVEMLAAINITLDFESCRSMEEDVWVEFYDSKNKDFQKEKQKKWAEDHKEKTRLAAEAAEIKRLADIESEKLRVEREKKEASEKAEREKQEALYLLKLEQEEKEKAEAKRLADEKAEADRLARNRNHQKAVNNRVKKKLVDCGIPEDIAVDVIVDIINNKIPEITINY